MATVDGITAAKAQEIEDASVVSGEINVGTGHLILTTAGGTDIDAGLVVEQTLSGKTLIEPTIVSFVNAQHDHGDADDGGYIASLSPPASASNTTTQTTASTSYQNGTNEVSVTLVAPPSGRIRVDLQTRAVNLSAGETASTSFECRLTSGSGTVIQAADSGAKRIVHVNDETTGSTFDVLTGLTPGATYFFRVQHKVSAGTGYIYSRYIMVNPL